MTLTESIIKHMDLERQELNLFKGIVDDQGVGRVLGGQVVGQALIAAARTVEDRPCHSLQVYFLRPGDPNEPVFYEVDRMRDGGSFATRRVLALQKGKAILSFTASFQKFEEGLAHQVEMPDIPGPDELLSEQQILEQRRIENPELDEKILQLVHGEMPVDIRRVHQFDYFKPEKMLPIKQSWYRSRKKLGNELSMHQSLLAFASDIGFLSTSVMPHGESPFTGLMMTSIDHSLWFHRPFNFEDWILMSMESTVSAGSRGYVRASMFSQDGSLIASATQEGLIRDTK